MPVAEWDERAIPIDTSRVDAGPVEGISPAHELPELYRAVLERVGSLEQSGHRREGELIRREAVTAYSRAWDEAARRRLEHLRTRAERVLGGHERARVERASRFAVRRPEAPVREPGPA